MGLKVIGAGLGRTGTLSLKFALEHLGFGPYYHMAEFMAHVPAHLPLWLDVAEGRPDWDAVFDGYESTVGYPGCTWWRELAVKWPEAKVILTVRDPESWFESASSTVPSPRMRNMLGNSPLKAFFDATVNGGFGDQVEDRAFMIDYFRRWNEEVAAEVPADRLLVFEARDGWEPLCAFLGVPVPPEPYPRVNSREQMNRRVAEGMQRMAQGAHRPPDGPPTAEQFAAMGQARLAAMREQAFPSGQDSAEGALT